MLHQLGPSEHIKYGEIEITQAKDIMITWSWRVKKAREAHHIAHEYELKHNIGLGTLMQAFGGDETWVYGKSGEGISTDFSQERVKDSNPNITSTFSDSYMSVVSGGFGEEKVSASLTIPGPQASPEMQDFWDGKDGADFHLDVALYQLEGYESGIRDPAFLGARRGSPLAKGLSFLDTTGWGIFSGGSRVLGSHRFKFLWEAKVD